ncbi:MAG: isoprenylcysteine carboxylmethyltransferase family protein [Phyllobacteriaceae bacterium]|nr:isoprenylcysteine carboxylmethyltransferase family protein [Phyllobacteriaceae bacterium]
MLGADTQPSSLAQTFLRYRMPTLWAIGAMFLAGALFTHSRWEGVLLAGADIHELIELAGLLAIAFGILGRIWATLFIGGRKQHEIVQDGPYSVSRNPLYLFSIIGAAGIGAQSGSLLMALFCAIVIWLVFTLTIRGEEAVLADMFGQPYRDYMARVPRLWPNVSLYREQATLLITPRQLYVTLRDSAYMFLAYPVFEVIELAQENGLVPILARLI